MFPCGWLEALDPSAQLLYLGVRLIYTRYLSDTTLGPL